MNLVSFQDFLKIFLVVCFVMRGAPFGVHCLTLEYLVVSLSGKHPVLKYPGFHFPFTYHVLRSFLPKEGFRLEGNHPMTTSDPAISTP